MAKEQMQAKKEEPLRNNVATEIAKSFKVN